MAGQDGNGGRKRRAADGGRGDPPKRPAPNTNRSAANPAPVSQMRSLIRTYEAKRRADAERSSGRGAAERRSTSLEMRNTTSSRRDRTDQRSQGRSEDSPRRSEQRSRTDQSSQGRSEDLPRLSEQRTESRKRIATPSRPVETEKEQVVAEEGSSLAKDPVSSGVDLASAEKNPALDKGKAVDASGDHPSAGGADVPNSVSTNHIFDSSSARENFLQFRYDGPGRLYQDRVACSELIYSVRGVEEGYPDLKVLAEKEAYEQFARTHVRNLAQLNDMVACYDFELAKARKEAEDEKSESAQLRAQVADLKESNEKLKETSERLKNRLRYLKEIEVPSGRATQIRGTLKMAEHFREKMKIDVPRAVTDKLARDLEFYKGQLEKIAEVKLNDEDLL